MTDIPLVSVVIVAYNNWPDLQLAIQSSLCQSHHRIEVIVVDNSSTDSTAAEVARQFGDRIRYVRQENLKDAGAYNTGFRLARGDFLQFLDGDDVLAADKVERQVAMMTADELVDLVYGDVRRFQSESGKSSWVDHTARDVDDMLATALDAQHGDVRTDFLGVLMRRRVLERVGEWDAAVYCTDRDFWLRAAWLGCVFRYCPGVMGFSRVHQRQMSADATAMNRGTEAVFQKALTYIDREPYLGMVRRNLALMRYVRSVARSGLTRGEALAKLHEARAMSSSAVPLAAYAVGLAAVIVPGAARVVTSPVFSRLRGIVARVAGFRTPRF